MRQIRIKIFFLGFVILMVLVIFRLFYWQVIYSDKLSTLGFSQYLNEKDIAPIRGQIKTSDGFSLVTNEKAYELFVDKKNIKESLSNLAKKLAPLLLETQSFLIKKETTESGKIYIFDVSETEKRIKEKLVVENAVWIPLAKRLGEEEKRKIETLNLEGLSFENSFKRFYPEASLSSHLLGFVGQDTQGADRGYFGLEGFYERELRGKPGLVRFEKDAFGRPIAIGEKQEEEVADGRNLVLHLDRTVQFIVEEKLKEGLEKYGAKEGSVVIMEPKTGGILAMASLPSYEPQSWYQYDPKLFKNPVVADSYEPGSTFKILVMSAALNEKKVTPQTRCDWCFGPRQIADYELRTWNNKYFPNTTMTDVLVHSDNTGMIFVAEKLGKEKFLKYLKLFGLGETTGIDLEEETSPVLKDASSWHLLDMATASFGQGIAITAIQMVRAVAALANGGKLMEPHVVSKVITHQGKVIEIKPKVVRQVISSATAKTIAEMMVTAVDNGEAKWAKPKGYRIAGKTGTAQIPVAGHYDKDRTIATFTGFAPADDPKFVMLVRLTEPTSSPWGSETAAPLFFSIAKELFSYYGIGPQ